MKQRTLDTLAIFLAEVIGTGLLVFLGCMGCIAGFPNVPSHLQICLNFGLAVMLIINIFGCVSGAHLNPAVTLAALVYKHVNLSMALIYMVAQFIGAFIGYGVLKAVTPNEIFSAKTENVGMCMTLPAVSNVEAFGIEFIITMILILICCGVWDPRNKNHHDSVPLRFGLAISCLAISAGPYTGASMNPARSFGPALWNANFDRFWIYFFAPMISALVTSIAFKLVFHRDVPEASHKDINLEQFPLNREKNNSNNA